MDESGLRVLQASSPDEVALVEASEQLGIFLDKRDQRGISLTLRPTGQRMVFDILFNFPFSSDRKRMGIILTERQTGKSFFLVKGADFIMKDLVQQFKRGFVIDECDNRAMDGLRTLVFAMRSMSDEVL